MTKSFVHVFILGNFQWHLCSLRGFLPESLYRDSGRKSLPESLYSDSGRDFLPESLYRDSGRDFLPESLQRESGRDFLPESLYRESGRKSLPEFLHRDSGRDGNLSLALNPGLSLDISSTSLGPQPCRKEIWVSPEIIKSFVHVFILGNLPNTGVP